MLPALSRFPRNQRVTRAVEFAFVAPILLLLFGIMDYVFGIDHSIQQIAAEAARSSVSGLNDAERSRIARDFIAAHARSYTFIDPTKPRVRIGQTGPHMRSFEVAVAYDMSGSVYGNLPPTGLAATTHN